MAQRRPGPVDPTPNAQTVLRPLPFGDAPITGGLWAERQRVNRETTIPVGAQQLEAAGSFENFKAAAAGQHGTYHGRVFQDGEVYKWLEALAWEQAREEDPQFAAWQRETTALIGDAQAPDGYLNTFEQVTEAESRAAIKLIGSLPIPARDPVTREPMTLWRGAPRTYGIPF